MSSEQEQLASCQEYVRRHQVQALVKDAIVQLCLHKPDSPCLFLGEHFARLAAGANVSPIRSGHPASGTAGD